MESDNNRGAPVGNQNAAKYDAATSRIQLRVTPETKALWVKAAQASEFKKLTPWIIEQLNQASKKNKLQK